VAECCNATCAVTSESSAQRLRSCSQCGVMRYCSGPCQNLGGLEAGLFT
jgi:hypothetical protein